MVDIKKIIKKNKDIKKINKKLITYEDYGVNPKKLLDHIQYQYFLSKSLDTLIINNIDPKIKETKKLLTYWNELKNKRFTKHQVNKNTNIFKYICIALSYRMFDSKLTIYEVLDALNNFIELTNKKILIYKNKINILTDFLWNDRRYGAKDFFKLSLIPTSKAIAKFNENKNIKYKNSFNIVKNKYINIFWKNSQNGYKEIDNNFFIFEKFVRLMVEAHKTKDMIDFTTRTNIGEQFGELIESYFKFVYNMIKYSDNDSINSITFILNEKVLNKYIFKMKRKSGWENFWEEPKKGKEKKNIIHISATYKK